MAYRQFILFAGLLACVPSLRADLQVFGIVNPLVAAQMILPPAWDVTSVWVIEVNDGIVLANTPDMSIVWFVDQRVSGPGPHIPIWGEYDARGLDIRDNGDVLVSKGGNRVVILQTSEWPVLLSWTDAIWPEPTGVYQEHVVVVGLVEAPEPGTVALLLGALAAIGLQRRRLFYRRRPD